MNWNWWILAAAKPATQENALLTWLPMIAIFGVFWFILIMPQRKQQKQRDAMIKNLNKGDKVVTVGGIHGEIVEIDDEDVKLRVADKVEIKFTRGSVARVKG
jgi:preprotein translocase subunit YajC